MIDVRSEKLIPIGQVPKLLPSRLPGRKLNLATVYRWANKGHLETLRIGGGRFTSEEAIERFVARQNGQHAKPSSTSTGARQRAIEVERALEKLGL